MKPRALHSLTPKGPKITSVQGRGGGEAKADEYKSKVGGRQKKDIPFTFYIGFSGDTKT